MDAWDGIDRVAVGLWLLVFPVYHLLHPHLARAFPHRTARGRMRILRRSWIEGLVERRDIIAAAQQTRNITMVNSLLGSSALILLGFTANLVFMSWRPGFGFGDPETVRVKLYLLAVVFGTAFSFFVMALRHLGDFNLTIGADPKVVEEECGNSIDFYQELIRRASSRYVLGVRTLHASFPVLVWIVSPWLMIGLTVFWAFRFAFVLDWVPDQHKVS